MTVVAVTFVKVPHALPVHAAPDRLHVTPWLFESFETVAETAICWPWTMVSAPFCESATLIAGFPPPQPKEIMSKARIITNTKTEIRFI